MSGHPVNRWSGSLPLICSTLALLMVMHGYGDFRRYGPPADEGGAEHVFFIAMALQLPMIAWLAFSMRREIKRALPLVATQLSFWSLALIAGFFCPGFH